MPSFPPKLPPGVRRLFRLPPSRGRLLRDMDEEVEAHLAQRAEELQRLGMDAADAWTEARRRFGDTEEFRGYAAGRAGRRARRLAVACWFADAAQDMRVAVRQLRQAPVLAAVVVLILACCIGATTAAYDVTRHLLLPPLPYPEGNRIVRLEARRAGDGEFHFSNLNVELVRLWAARARTIQDVAAMEFVHKRPGVGARESGEPDTLPAVAMLTPSFLPLLRVSPVLGRGFTPEDAHPDAPAVALLGEAWWRSRYGGTPDVIGRSITVADQPRIIVGVLPRAVTLPTQSKEPLDILLPFDLLSAPPARGIEHAFARLRPGVVSTAARELQSLLRTLPDTGDRKGLHAEVTTAPEQVDPGRRRAVQVLFAATAALLLIACANVAGLLLMRVWARQREFTIRRALGAWRGRLARQLLSENLLLALPSGALGLLVAWLGVRAAIAVRPWTLGFLDTLRLDSAAFLWTAAVSKTTALLFGVGPALLAGRQPLDAALRTGGAVAGRSGAHGWAHGALVVGQLALSLMFLSAAGVLTRSFVALVQTPVGYEPAGLVAVSVRGALGQDVVMGAVREALASTPGVREVAIGTLPLDQIGSGVSAVDGPLGVRAVGIATTGLAYVGPEYFRVSRIPLVRGRGFDAGPGADREVVINRALARRLWPGCRLHGGACEVLGARMRLGDGEGASWVTVVGVAGDLRMPGAAAEHFGLQVYLPASTAPEPSGAFVLRAQGDPATLRPLLARAVEGAGVGATLDRVTPAEWLLEFAYGGPRFAVALFGAFAVLAVALAMVGLFGVVAYAVARRTREIGVRMALGADAASLIRTIIGGSARLVALGCGLGLLGAYATSRALTSLVYGVSPTDPTALGSALVLLVAVALAAAALPLRRALRVNPAATLRAE